MRDSEFKSRLHAVLTKYRKQTTPPLGRCMWWKSECLEPVGSHSVSRACLDRLQHKGHVVRLRADVSFTHRQTDTISELIGVNVAGVFPCFCARHDDCIFRTVDKPLSTCSQRQCDLLAFRSICREAYTKYKVASFNLSQGMVEDHPTPHGVFTMDMMCCCTDLLAHKVGMEESLDKGISTYHHFAFEFAHTPILAASATFSPQVTVDGLSLSGGLEWVTLNILPTVVGGIAVLSWEKSHSSKATRLVDSLLRVKSEWLSDVFFRFVIDNAENAFYAPSWWGGLSSEEQSTIVTRYRATMLTPHEKMHGLYETTGAPIVDWRPIRKYPVT